MSTARRDKLTIGDLARETGCKVQTIRYYEQIGLIPEPDRSAGNHRLYEPAHRDRLAFVRHARELGFSLDAIRQLLGLVDHPTQPCEGADAIARAQLEQIEERIARLDSLKRELRRMIEQCEGGNIAHCRVIEVLADHSKCLDDDHADPVALQP